MKEWNRVARVGWAEGYSIRSRTASSMRLCFCAAFPDIDCFVSVSPPRQESFSKILPALLYRCFRQHNFLLLRPLPNHLRMQVHKVPSKREMDLSSRLEGVPVCVRTKRWEVQRPLCVGADLASIRIPLFPRHHHTVFVEDDEGPVKARIPPIATSVRYCPSSTSQERFRAGGRRTHVTRIVKAPPSSINCSRKYARCSRASVSSCFS